MKKIIVLFLNLIVCFIGLAQSVTTGSLFNLKDGYGTGVTYIGDIKNNQPNGLGIFIYNNSLVTRHVGYFVNGLPEGKGVLMYQDGGFISGMWKKGKPHGSCAELNKSGDIYFGEFINGKKEGKGKLVFKDNGMMFCEMKNDNYDGRNIYAGKSGLILYDNIYRNGKKNGLGVQYETEGNKYFEGEWSNGEWQKAGKAYRSFLRNPGFLGDKTNQYISMGIRNEKNLLNDSGFYYSVPDQTRYFGTFMNGEFANGIIVQGDSLRVFGAMKKDQVTGYSAYYKLKEYYHEGTYTNNVLGGKNCLMIELNDRSVFYGSLHGKGKSDITGKTFYSNNYNELLVGEFMNNEFTGKGYKLLNNGYRINGLWDKGRCTKLTQITNDKGSAVNLKPKTMAEAIAILVNSGYSSFEVFHKEEFLDEHFAFAELYFKSHLSFPGSLMKDAVMYDYSEYPIYFSTFIENSSYAMAVKKYNELCRQIQTEKIVMKPGADPVLLYGERKEAYEGERTVSKFKAEADAIFPSDVIVSVFIYKTGENKYGVAVAICEEESEIFEDEIDWYDF